MKRKLVKQGVRALTVTVPAFWAKQKNLSAGDEVELTVNENTISIYADKMPPLKELTINARGLPPLLADRFVARSYQKGYDQINVDYDDPQVMLAIKNKVAELMGFEVINTSKGRVEIQSIANKLDLNFDILLRRTFLILLAMGETMHSAWKNGLDQELHDLSNQDMDINRFTNYCLRYLNKDVQVMNFGRSMLFYLIERLEDLGDEFKRLGAFLITVKPDNDTLILLRKLNEMLRLSYEFFYKPDRNKAIKALSLSDEISELIEKGFSRRCDSLKAYITIEAAREIIYHITTTRLDKLKQITK